MTTVQRAPHEARLVDVAGVAWPLYKLCSVGTGALVFMIALLVAAPTATAVLTAAAVASIVWLAGALIR